MRKEADTIALMHHTFICVTEQPYRLLVTVFRFWIEIRMWSFRIKLDVSFIPCALPLVRSYCSASFTYFTFFTYSRRTMSTVTYHIITFLMSVWLFDEGKVLHTSPKLLYTSSYFILRRSQCKLHRSYCTFPDTVHFGEVTVHFGELSVHFNEVSVQFTKVTVHFGEFSVNFSENIVHFTEVTVHFTEISVHFAEVCNLTTSENSSWHGIMRHLCNGMMTAAVLK